MPSIGCSLCCAQCKKNAVAGQPKIRKHELQSPYEKLYNFLAAGTVTIPLQCRDVPCSHLHATDGWHVLPSAATLEPMLVPNDTPLLRLRQLDFLMKHSFIAATCRLDAVVNILFVRIYLIPWDLPGVHGKLRVRDEISVVAPARRHLRNILAEIVQDDDAWDALSPPGGESAKQFFGHETVGMIPRLKQIHMIDCTCRIYAR